MTLGVSQCLQIQSSTCHGVRGESALKPGLGSLIAGGNLG